MLFAKHSINTPGISGMHTKEKHTGNTKIHTKEKKMTHKHFDQVCIELRIKAINNFTVENNDKKKQY